MSGQQVFYVPVAWWWKVTKYIYSSTVLVYNFDLLVLYLIISICDAFVICISTLLQFRANHFTIYSTDILRFIANESISIRLN